MKRFIALALLALAACGGNASYAGSDDEEPMEDAPSADAGAVCPPEEPGPGLCLFSIWQPVVGYCNYWQPCNPEGRGR